jgi:sirohydrochlorin ferrochelatase
VTAIETGSVAVDADLLTVLAERLDGPTALRLLRWWEQQPRPDPRWPALIGCVRDPLLAAWLRDRLASPARPGAAEVDACLLPLLGFQRQAEDAALLAGWALAPQPGAVRRAALEGLAVGLSAWPQPALRGWLRRLAADLDPVLAAAAVDLLARLPRARADLMALGDVTLAAAVEQRRQRRLAALPVSPLLLVVHGRAGGVVPVEVQELAAELARRRQAPVLVQALTGDPPKPPAAATAPDATTLTLVPLMLLPGGHVRHDIPAIAAHWRLQGPVRRLPFLGAWPAWQCALAEELAELAGLGPPIVELPASEPSAQPLLLHHPLEGGLAQRYLATLECRVGARCVATPYSADHLAELQLTLMAPAVLPLALAANRLTDSLASLVGSPLLQRPRFRQLLLAELEALP